MANFSLRLDGIFWILRFSPRTPVDILYISRINSIASRQFGAVSRQYGAVSRQYGTVSRQYGAVRGQYGAVRGLFSEFSFFFVFIFSVLHILLLTAPYCLLATFDINIFTSTNFFRLHIFSDDRLNMELRVIYIIKISSSKQKRWHQRVSWYIYPCGYHWPSGYAKITLKAMVRVLLWINNDTQEGMQVTG